MPPVTARASASANLTDIVHVTNFVCYVMPSVQVSLTLPNPL